MAGGIALALMLAQTCVAEIDLQIDTAECYAMLEINADAARRKAVTLERQTRKFNTIWKHENPARPWILHLTSDASVAPQGWPAKRGPWGGRWAARWESYLQLARVFLSNQAGGRWDIAIGLCIDKRGRELKPDNYGGDPDDGGKNADDPKPCARARRVRCFPRELQAYWNTTRCWAKRRARTIPASVASGH